MATPFFGMRGTGEFSVTGQRPENYREKILDLFPNGDAPLTAMLAMLKREKTDDPKFHWYERQLSTQSVTGTAGAFVYKDSNLATAYAASDDFAAGLTVYVKMALASVKEFRAGHQVLLRDASDETNDVNGKVTAQVQNGATSYIAVRLLEADGTGNGDLSNCDTVLIIGSVHPEGAGIPDSVTYDPTEYNNYTQIFRTPLEATRTALQTHLRTGDLYLDMKKQALQYHAIEKEKAFIWGVATLNTGANGKPERTTGGLIKQIATYSSSNKEDYSALSSGSYQGKTWAQGGEDWLMEKLELIFRKGSTEKMAFVGSGVLLGLDKIAKLGAQVNMENGDVGYGIKVKTWMTPFGTLHMKLHPLFSYETTNRNSMLIVEPQMLVTRYVQDTIFKKDKRTREGGFTSLDGIKEEYLTECGLEIHHTDTMGYLSGFNTDNTN